MEIYIVKPSDTVDKIANAYNIKVETIIKNNQLEYPYALAIGQALLLSTPSPKLEEVPNAITNGYAYPYIALETLKNTLPFLSTLSLFSYGFTKDGELIPPQVNDDDCINSALSFQVAPILTLTPFDEGGFFNNYLISRVVNDETAQNRLIQNLKEKILEKGYQGIDVDFEYIQKEDKDAYANFVKKLRIEINSIGYPVSVALAPKTSDNQPGLLYGGMDYALLGEAADSVLLMTYEWGYTYGPPLPVAPLPNVKEVVEYALTRIPASKISLGIPNYGYDWPLPYKKGTTKATAIGNLRAVQIAIEQGVAIEYDQKSQAPFFTYTQDGISHIVWFEDLRSMQAKFNLVKDYNLRGMGYWQIMRLFLANWLLLEDQFQILK